MSVIRAERWGDEEEGWKKMAVCVGEVPGKRVQELSKTDDELPLRFIRHEPDKPTKEASPLPSTIPVIDLRLLGDESEEKEEEMEKFRGALQSWGFFQAIGHGISSSFLGEVRNIVKAFFQLPMEEKKRYSKLVNDSNGEDGWQGYGSDPITSQDQILDWTDRLYLIVQPEENRKLMFWPQYPDTFRDIVDEYTTKTNQVAKVILSAMAELLNLDKNYFEEQFGEKISVDARFSYYPRCSRPDLVLGLRPHSDVSGITIVLQDESVEGLQVLKDGEWFKAPVIPDALLFNVGDQMEIMSNGIFKSAVHRVVTNTEKARLSLALFYAPEPEMVIKPADGLIDQTRPKFYKQTKAKDYSDIFFENYADGKRAIDLAKV